MSADEVEEDQEEENDIDSSGFNVMSADEVDEVEDDQDDNVEYDDQAEDKDERQVDLFLFNIYRKKEIK